MSEDEHDTSLPSLTRECEQLRRRVAELETEIERARAREELFTRTVWASTSFARKVREEARRDAELLLRKARAKTQKMLASVERDRLQAESDLLGLRQIAEQTRAGLSTFLAGTLDQLRAQDERTPLAREPLGAAGGGLSDTLLEKAGAASGQRPDTEPPIRERGV